MRLLAVTLALVAQTGSPIFRFETDRFWLNLHHFLYVLGRAELRIADSRREAVAGAPADQAEGLKLLTPAEQAAWRQAVTFYAANLSNLSHFDEPVLATSNALRATAANGPASAATIDSAIGAALDRAAPIYRKVWWPRHRDTNREWVKRMEPLLKQHGAPVLAYVTRTYQLPWTKNGYPVQLSAWSNWAGAYSAEGVELLVVSTMHKGNYGSLGLDTIFHEAMHQWDTAMNARLEALAKAHHTDPPKEGLTHAMIFYTAGEAVRSAVPDHTTQADASGIWNRGLGPFKPALEKIWKPYLEGKGTLDEALLGLLKF